MAHDPRSRHTEKGFVVNSRSRDSIRGPAFARATDSACLVSRADPLIPAFSMPLLYFELHGRCGSSGRVRNEFLCVWTSITVLEKNNLM
jgi:hypothetical protein